jgi:phage N-6-adenine-methyltransferase
MEASNSNWGTAKHNDAEWWTPDPIFDALSTEFDGFDVDACASSENARCPVFFTKEQNGLWQVWGNRKIWVNPPYSRIEPWVKKAEYECRKNKATVVLLVKVSTGSQYWYEYVRDCAAEVRFIVGRVAFKGPSSTGKGASYDCAILVYRPDFDPKTQETKTHWVFV